MINSATIKNLLDTNPDVQAMGRGPWKRTGKRQVSGGVERCFKNKAETCFVRTLEKSGRVEVSHLASTQDGLTAAMEALADTSAPADRSASHRVDADPKNQRVAEALLEKMMQGAEIDPDELEGAGVAFANRMLFGVFGFMDEEGSCVATPEESEDATIMVAIVPDVHWRQQGCWFDRPLYIDELVPHPESSESPNETSEWRLGGFTNPYEAIRALLDAGFVWDADLQKSLPEPADPNLVPWLEAGARSDPHPTSTKQEASEDKDEGKAPFGIRGLENPADLAAIVATGALVFAVRPPRGANESEFWGSAKRFITQVSNDPRLPALLGRIPPDSGLGQDLPDDTWTFRVFSAGRALNEDLASMFAGNLKRIVSRLSRPRP